MILEFKKQANNYWESPHVECFAAQVLTPSWNTYTPEGTAVRFELRVLVFGQWSKWYKIGDWSFYSDAKNLRISYSSENDDYGKVSGNSFFVREGYSISVYQVRYQLQASSSGKFPEVHRMHMHAGLRRKSFTTVSKPKYSQGIEHAVPRLSQFMHLGEHPALDQGGIHWCSPTTAAMALRYFQAEPTSTQLATLPKDQEFDQHARYDADVNYAAMHMYDPATGGTGIWQFNTAYVAEHGLQSRLDKYESLQDVEDVLYQGGLVGLSLHWDNSPAAPKEKNLPYATWLRTPGHILLAVGFTDKGDPIINDPAAPAGNHEVRRVYSRETFERLWQVHSGGLAMIYNK